MYRIVFFLCYSSLCCFPRKLSPVAAPQSPAEFHQQEAARWQRVFEWHEETALMNPLPITT